jgi:hypothetical protein
LRVRHTRVFSHGGCHAAPGYSIERAEHRGFPILIMAAGLAAIMSPHTPTDHSQTPNVIHRSPACHADWTAYHAGLHVDSARSTGVLARCVRPATPARLGVVFLQVARSLIGRCSVTWAQARLYKGPSSSLCFARLRHPVLVSSWGRISLPDDFAVERITTAWLRVAFRLLLRYTPPASTLPCALAS